MPFSPKLRISDSMSGNQTGTNGFASETGLFTSAPTPAPTTEGQCIKDGVLVGGAEGASGGVEGALKAGGKRLGKSVLKGAAKGFVMGAAWGFASWAISEVVGAATGDGYDPCSDDDEPGCFPGSAIVELAPTGSSTKALFKRMDQLTVGDRVKTADMHGRIIYDEVWGWAHRVPDREAAYLHVQIGEDASSGLKLSHKHLLHTGEKCCKFQHLVEAQSLHTGDKVWLDSGRGVLEPTTVTAISEVFEIGVFNPQTASGRIVVNGIAASTYSDLPRWLSPALAHMMLQPLRVLSRLVPMTWVHDPGMSFWENRIGRILLSFSRWCNVGIDIQS